MTESATYIAELGRLLLLTLVAAAAGKVAALRPFAIRSPSCSAFPLGGVARRRSSALRRWPPSPWRPAAIGRAPAWRRPRSSSSPFRESSWLLWSREGRSRAIASAPHHAISAWTCPQRRADRRQRFYLRTGADGHALDPAAWHCWPAWPSSCSWSQPTSTTSRGWRAERRAAGGGRHLAFIVLIAVTLASALNLFLILRLAALVRAGTGPEPPPTLPIGETLPPFEGRRRVDGSRLPPPPRRAAAVFVFLSPALRELPREGGRTASDPPRRAPRRRGALDRPRRRRARH